MDRTIAPEIKKAPKISFQQPEIYTLPNGADLYCIRETEDETVQIDFRFSAGGLENSSIIANLTGNLLLSGTEEKSSNELEDAIDLLGGYTDVEITKENAMVSIVGLKEHILELTEIVVDAICNANLDPKELKQLIQAKKKEYIIGQEKVSTKARRGFLQQIFERSPYGDLTALDDFENISREDIIQFYRDNYLFGLDSISIVGNIDDKKLESIRKLALMFKRNDKVKKKYNYDYSPETIHLEKKGAVQTAIRVGRILFNKTHPDFKKFKILNTVLGGYFGSRLMFSLREDKGFTYGVGSGVAQMQETGYFFISTEVGVEYKEESIQIIKAEMKRLQTQEVTQRELDLVKNYMIGHILEHSDGAEDMMNRFLVVKKYDMKLSYYNELIEVIYQTTPREIQELAKKYLNWEDFVVVTAG